MGLKSYSQSTQTLLFHSPAQTTAHSSELIYHIMKFRDQTSVLLSVVQTSTSTKEHHDLNNLNLKKQVYIVVEHMPPGFHYGNTREDFKTRQPA